jgi:Protein of unknown function (DUF3800)
MLTPTVQKRNIRLQTIRGILTVVTGRGTCRVKVAYSDESGTGSKKNEPIIVVTAVLFNMDSQWEPVEEQMFELCYRIPKRLLHENREFKGKVLYRAIRKNDPEAAETLRKILAIVVRNKLTIFYGPVDRVGFEDHRDLIKVTDREYEMTAHDRAFSDCIEQVDASMHLHHPNEKVLWIADRGSYERQMKSELLSFQRYEKSELDVTRPEFYDRPLHIVETVYFGDSKETFGLQLADVCCSTITLHSLETWYGWRPCAGPFYEQIRKNVVRDGTQPAFRKDR